MKTSVILVKNNLVPLCEILEIYFDTKTQVREYSKDLQEAILSFIYKFNAENYNHTTLMFTVRTPNKV